MKKLYYIFQFDMDYRLVWDDQMFPYGFNTEEEAVQEITKRHLLLERFILPGYFTPLEQ
jgi:hypothetical protein